MNLMKFWYKFKISQLETKIIFVYERPRFAFDEMIRSSQLRTDCMKESDFGHSTMIRLIFAAQYCNDIKTHDHPSSGHYFVSNIENSQQLLVYFCNLWSSYSPSPFSNH